MRNTAAHNQQQRRDRRRPIGVQCRQLNCHKMPSETAVLCSMHSHTNCSATQARVLLAAVAAFNVRLQFAVAVAGSHRTLLLCTTQAEHNTVLQHHTHAERPGGSLASSNDAAAGPKACYDQHTQRDTCERYVGTQFTTQSVAWQVAHITPPCAHVMTNLRTCACSAAQLLSTIQQGASQQTYQTYLNPQQQCLACARCHSSVCLYAGRTKQRCT